MTPTKITLSNKELSLVTNADFFLTKQVIIGKVYNLFAAVIPSIHSTVLNVNNALPAEVVNSVPKIYKGENYLQLPYVMLDYPRCFNGSDIFAVRTMFWWANFFSITLHISGFYKTALANKLLRHQAILENAFYIGVNEDQWQHHFNEDNYLPYQHISPEQQIKLFEENNFIKLALQFKLDDWNEMQPLLTKGYAKIAGLVV